MVGVSASRRRRWRLGAWVLLVLALVLSLLVGLGGSPPVRADSPEAPSAFVEVDGRPLFRVWASRDFSPDQRVDAANTVLRQVVRTTAPVEVTVETQNNLPVIAINGTSLLTVTERDVPEGLESAEQADIWRRQLQAAIDTGRREREPRTIRRRMVFVVLALGGAFALQRLLSALWRRVFPDAWLRDPESSDNGYRPQGARFLQRASLRLVQISLWIVVVLSCADLIPLTRTWARQLFTALGDSLGSPFLPLGERSYSVLDAIILIGLFVLLTRLVAVIQRVLRTRVLQYTGIGLGAQEAIAVVTQYALLFLGSLVLLQLWGLDLSSLTLFASVLGVGVGLGLQGITKNFISGLIIIFERPIQVGDFVEIGDLQGTVQKIGIRSTEVVTLDRISIIVPNSEFIESRVVNWSHGSPISRLRVPVTVAYGSDTIEVRAALVEACANHPAILTDPPPRVFFKGFGDSALNFMLLVWINQPMRQYEISSDLNYRIETVLRQRNIAIPFPQRDLHLAGEAVQLHISPQLSDTLQALLEHLQRDRNS